MAKRKKNRVAIKSPNKTISVDSNDMETAIIGTVATFALTSVIDELLE